jgi:thiosulfate/3-mercaptopyruvate sulfurtransferase
MSDATVDVAWIAAHLGDPKVGIVEIDVSRAAYEQGPEPPEIMATRAAVEGAIGDSSKLVLDVRSQLEYVGERFWPSGATEGTGRSGHVPAAISVPIDLISDWGKAPDTPIES